MLWSASPQPTDYYVTLTAVWSGFWLLDITGERILNANRFDSGVAEYFLDRML